MQIRETIDEDFAFVTDGSLTEGEKRYDERENYTYTMEHDGVIMCIGGFKMMNRSTAWCWLDISCEAEKHKLSMIRTIKGWIDAFAYEHKLKRIQAYVDAGYYEGLKFIEHLGFERESLMKDAMPNGDAIMYRRLL
jgi:hypothetical protein